MAHTHHQNIYHLVWSTKERKPLMIDGLKHQMFAFIAGAFKTAGCKPIQIGGMPDHIHALVGIPPKCAVSVVVRDIKICSCKWAQQNYPGAKNFAWQEGFGSFTVSASQIDAVQKYILNQEEHHKVRSYQDEFKRFLELYGVNFDEKYLWS